MWVWLSQPANPAHVDNYHPTLFSANPPVYTCDNINTKEPDTTRHNRPVHGTRKGWLCLQVQKFDVLYYHRFFETPERTHMGWERKKGSRGTYEP